MDCGGFLLLWGVGAVVGGAFAVYSSVMVWVNPESRLSKALLAGWRSGLNGRLNATIQPYLGVVVGPVFIIAGVWDLWGQLHCANISREFTNLTALQFTFWWPIVPFTVFAAGVGLANAVRYSLRPLSAIANTILCAAFGFCGAEAAAYHTGDMANRWATVAAISIVLSLLFSLPALFNRERRPT